MKSDNETVTGYLNLSKITKVKYYKINKELTFIYSYLKYMLSFKRKMCKVYTHCTVIYAKF